MPGGVGLELIIVGGLLALLVIAFVVGRRLRPGAEKKRTVAAETKEAMRKTRAEVRLRRAEERKRIEREREAAERRVQEEERLRLEAEQLEREIAERRRREAEERERAEEERRGLEEQRRLEAEERARAEEERRGREAEEREERRLRDEEERRAAEEERRREAERQARARHPAPARRAFRARGTGLATRVWSFLGAGVPRDTDWQGLEAALVAADTGPRAARAVVERVRRDFRPGDDPEELLVQEIASLFEGDRPFRVPANGLTVIMVVGVNGTGKTTTIGKLAYLLEGQGRSVAVAASDTFRAGAIEQLSQWAERSGADVVAQGRGADPGAVAFDAAEAARSRGREVLIVDTAGRIHTKKPLMDELGKVKRSLEKVAGKVDEILLVLDATTGQNGIAQARTFLEAVDVTGIALTKVDGTAKGGVVLAIREELGVPVVLVGAGEGIEDLQPFDPRVFADSLVRG